MANITDVANAAASSGLTSQDWIVIALGGFAGLFFIALLIWAILQSR